MMKETKCNLRMEAFGVVVDNKLVYDGTSYAIYMNISSAKEYCDSLDMGPRAQTREIKMEVVKYE